MPLMDAFRFVTSYFCHCCFTAAITLLIAIYNYHLYGSLLSSNFNIYWLVNVEPVVVPQALLVRISSAWRGSEDRQNCRKILRKIPRTESWLLQTSRFDVDIKNWKSIMLITCIIYNTLLKVIRWIARS